MGLEGVELIMELEDRFGIELPDRDLPGTLTVAGLYRLVLSKLASEWKRWDPHDVWSVLCAAIEEELGVPADQFEPRTALADLMDWPRPDAKRRRTRGAVAVGEQGQPGGGLADSEWLQFADLLMDLAERLGVDVSGDELRKVVTVWDLYSLLLPELGHVLAELAYDPAKAGECLSSEVFYRLRRAIAEKLGVPQRTISPASKTGDLIPRRGRRRTWRALSEAMALELPALARAETSEGNVLVAPALLLFWSLAIGIPAAMAGLIVPGAVLIVLGVALSAAAHWLGLTLARRFAGEVPNDCATIRGLVRETVRLNRDALTQGRHPAARAQQQVWDILRDAIAANFHWVKPEEIRGRTPLRELSVRPAG